MNKYKSQSLVLFIFILYLLSGTGLRANAYQIAEPDRSEVIEEVSKVTGLTSDLISLAANENPKLLDDLGDAVFTVKIINSFSGVRDVEALEDIYEYSMDKVLTKTLPPNMTFFLTAFKAYKTSLEMIRDYVFIPEFDERIYTRYFDTRLQQLKQGDMSLEAKQHAFSVAVMDKSSDALFPDRGYYVVKNKMYGDVLKSKGYNPELVGTDEKLGSYVWKQIDDFWMNRMEARLNHELVKKGKKEIINSVWENASRQLRNIKAAAVRNQQTETLKNSNKKAKEKNGQPAGQAGSSGQEDENMPKLQQIFEAQFSKDGKLTYSRPWQYDTNKKCYNFGYCYRGRMGDTWCWEDVCVSPGQAKEILKRGSWN